MKISAKPIVLALAAALCANVLASCGNTSDKNTEDNANQAQNTGKDTEIADNTDGTDNAGEAELSLPEGKFLEGETFNLYHAHNGFESYYVQDVQSGDLKGEAVTKRNEAVEERTGVKLNFVHTTQPSDQGAETQKISSLILAGDTTYDAFVSLCN